MKINMWKLLIVAVIVSISTVACKDERDNFMVDDSISFVGQQQDLQKVITLSVYNEEYEFPVVKNGKGQTAATVNLDASQEALAAYNTANGTNYVLLPSNCYDLTQSLRFAEGDMRKFAKVKWDPTTVASLDKDVSYVIPIELSVAGNSVPLSEGRNQMFIQLQISAVSISAPTTTALVNKEFVYNGEITIDSPIAVMDVVVNYKIDNSLVAEYNKAHGTSYLQVPDGMATLAATSSTIAAAAAKTTYACRISTAKIFDNISVLQNGGGYVVPVRISSVTEGVNTSDEIAYILLANKEIKGPWTMLEGNEIGWAFAPTPGNAMYTGARLFDGSWGDEWISFINDKNTFPMVFVVDMGEPHIFTKFVIGDSYNYQGVYRNYQISVSDQYNGASTSWTLVASGMRDYNWTDVGTNKEDPRLRYDYPVQKFAAGRYLKFVILNFEPYYEAANGLGKGKLGDVQGVGL